MRRIFSLAVVGLLSVSAWSQSVRFNMIQMGQKGGTVVGDFNGDGREDMIVFTQSSYAVTSAFHLLVSTSTGAYSTAPSYSVPNGGTANANISGYTVGDFNRDGKLDLAIVTGSAGQTGQPYLYTYLGEGNGTFHPPIATPLPFTPAFRTVTSADVNHDGKMDLIIMDSAGNLMSYLGDGAGHFTAGPSSPTTNVVNIYTGDFDGDGKVDVLGVNCDQSGCQFTSYYGDGTGRFGSPTTVSMGQADPIVADVDGDGKSDIISATIGLTVHDSVYPDQPYLTVFYGAADRTFQQAQIPTSQCTFGRVSIADFNGDHIPDIIFPEHQCVDTPSSGTPAQMAFLAGRGNRAFGSEQAVFNSTYDQFTFEPSTTVLRANNGDSKPDFFFGQTTTPSSNTFEYFMMVNSTSGTFAHCNAPNSATGFRICSPSSGSTVYSPVKFSIGAAGSVPMRKVEVWADGVKKYEQLYAFSHYAFLDASIALTKGTHAITIISAGWDNSLQSKKYSITVH